MSISLSSSSVPVANSPGKAEVFFNNQSTSNLSHSFIVNYEPYYIEAFNLGASDVVSIQMVTSSPGGPQYAPYIPFHFQKQLTNTRTKVRIDQPGVYNLLYSGPSVATITVVGFPGTMTHESTTEFAEALAAVQQAILTSTIIIGDTPITVTGNGTLLTPYHIGLNPTVQTSFIVGDSPITVTGNGTVGNPYHVGVILATNLEEENGTPANHVISAGVLKHIVNATTANQDVRLGVGAGINAPGEICIGYNSGLTAVNSDAIISIGERSFLNATLSQFNIGIGSSAGREAVLDTGNVLIGTGAGVNSIGAYSASVLLGAEAGELAPIASLSMFLGYRAGRFSNNGPQTPRKNILVGPNSGISANIQDCITVGWSTFSHATVNGCVAIGNTAGNNNNANSSIFIGTLAGSNSFAVPLDTMTGVIAIGNGATSTNASSVVNFNNGIFIGNNAGVNEGFTNNIIIGSDSTALNATANNQIVLGTSTQTQLVTAGSVISGGVIGPSDYRLKKDIKSYEGGLSTLMKITPISFLWDEFKLVDAKIPHLTSDLYKQQYGVIAQDLQKILPNAVATYGDNGYLFVHYDRLIPHMLSAIRELAEEITSLKFNSTIKG